MTESPKLLPFQCMISFDYDGGENHDPDGIMKIAKKVVEDGGGWIEVDFQFMPGFGYWIKPDQKNPLDPIPEELKGKIKVGPGSTADVEDGKPGAFMSDEEFYDNVCAPQ